MDRVNSITRECFSALIHLRQLDQGELPAPEALHQKVRGFVDEMLKSAAHAGFSQQDAQDIAYALVATMDETALAKPESIRGYWMGNLLQYHYFRENVAGDGFFQRLTAIRNDPHRLDVLRVYYLCLLFGFQGRYRIRGGELELMNLIDSVQQDVSRSRRGDPDHLSPKGERSTEALAAAKRTAPILLVSAAAVAVALLVFGSLKLGLKSSVDSAAHEIEAWNQK